MAKKAKKRQRPSPDTDLARENFASLNETFYRMTPQAYLKRRFYNLLLTMGRGDELMQMLIEGLSFDGYEVRWHADDKEVTEDEDARKRFSIAECEVLLHHASETLLRLYLVHAAKSECPWLDLSREKDPRAFRKEVRRLAERAGKGEERERIEWVFFASSDRTNLTPTPHEERWRAASDNIADLLAHYAQFFLDSASYNAAKHGLAVSAGESSFRINDNDLLSASGPSVLYLTVKHDAASRRPQWAQETKWIDQKAHIGFIYIAIELIEALWQIAAGRYTGAEIGEIRLFEGPTVWDLKHINDEELPRVAFEKMAMHLSYYEEPKDGAR